MDKFTSDGIMAVFGGLGWSVSRVRWVVSRAFLSHFSRAADSRSGSAPGARADWWASGGPP
jgi:hypothetical protein